jgi:cytochrome c oxidase subunit 3
MKKSIYRHPYHIVTKSPWPLVTAIWLLSVVIGGVLYLHFYKLGFPYFRWALLNLIYVLIAWWNDIIFESTYEGAHTTSVQQGLRYGMLLFIVSEIMFSFAFFWAFFHSSISPAIQIGAIWPPLGINVFNPWEIPLLNTLLLLFSGACATAAHHLVKAGITTIERESQVKVYMQVAIFFGILFTCFQVYEYIIADFSISDGIYGSVFYLATGFHGLHVLIGTTFLIVIYFRICYGHFGGFEKQLWNSSIYIKRHYFGVDAAIWYRHFVDVVWLFLFVSIYWWGS